jgi:hypothetical protein
LRELRELRGLERVAGRDTSRVDHRPGAHDDVANVACIALALVVAGAGVSDPQTASNTYTDTMKAPPTGSATARALYGANFRGSLEEAAYGKVSDLGDLGRRAFGD